jgi:cytochrome oxidase Cu insertion factor (SCO1/SenC/PrrC family)
MAKWKQLTRGRAFAAAGAVVVGAGAGAALALDHRGSSSPAAAAPPTPANVAWPAGRRRAPNFALRDQTGAPISLRAERGRVVIVTFIDPVCTNLCPLEAKVLEQAVHGFSSGERPAVTAVSVNPLQDARRNFRADARKWRLDRNWRWAVGSRAQLARVWKAYAIGVQVHTISAAGLTVHEVDHTEASYVIDRRGFERALFVYPFSAADVEKTVRQVERGSSA